jgi:hypothetical protein
LSTLRWVYSVCLSAARKCHDCDPVPTANQPFPGAATTVNQTNSGSLTVTAAVPSSWLRCSRPRRTAWPGTGGRPARVGGFPGVQRATSFRNVERLWQTYCRLRHSARSSLFRSGRHPRRVTGGNCRRQQPPMSAHEEHPCDGRDLKRPHSIFHPGRLPPQKKKTFRRNKQNDLYR